MSDTERAPARPESKGYLPVLIESIRLDTEPPFALYIRPTASQACVLYCERQTPFTRDARRRLLQNRISELYISEADRAAYSRYIAEHLADVLRDPRLTARDKSHILYDSAQAVVEDVLREPARRANIERGKAIVKRTVAFMRSPDFMLEHLLRTISCDYYLYTHSINVTAYSIALAMRCGFVDPATLREIANGALLHDVGESVLDSAIKNKPGPLSDGEWAEMRRHPEEGLKLLEKTGCLGEIAQDIVLSHHEKLDGSGYPNQRSGEDISPFVRIVTIADIFDALTTDRHHQKRMRSFEALKLMGETMRDQIDMPYFRNFVGMMGLSKV
ncbi:MAG: HD domain-containing protein [Candidatus Hydrogenedentes bacterium]|nr:HD domain-containing protein [Candidatus Hydrogenedentota bacterium]